MSIVDNTLAPVDSIIIKAIFKNNNVGMKHQGF